MAPQECAAVAVGWHGAIAARAVKRFEEWKKQGKPPGKTDKTTGGKATAKGKGKTRKRS